MCGILRVAQGNAMQSNARTSFSNSIVEGKSVCMCVCVCATQEECGGSNDKTDRRWDGPP